MSIRRTPSIEVNEEFDHVVDITKAWEDRATGKRYIRGVASGILEDRDGERCSKRAIAKMAAQSTADGAIKLVAGHDQDWLTEFGDVVKVEHDAENDELLVECELPAPGMDPIADKAFTRLTTGGEKFGFSIGGKLRKAYFELVDPSETAKGGRPRRRKVLDDILLRHVALTKKPSYRGTFAEAIAKTVSADPQTDDFSVDEDDGAEDRDAAEILAKVFKARPDDRDADDAAEDNDPATKGNGSAEPGPGGDEPTAATADTTPGPGDDADAAAEAAKLPMAKRHLSCPSCGHEFAADLPTTDPSTDSTTDNEDASTASSKEPTTVKTADDTLAAIRALVEGDVAKTEPEAKAAEPTEPTRADDVVAKTDDVELPEVLKMLAASHRHADERIDAVAEATTKGFETVAKAVQKLAERLDAQPQGRRSVARADAADAGVASHLDVGKTADEDVDDIDAQIAKTNDPREAMKLVNKRDRNIG